MGTQIAEFLYLCTVSIYVVTSNRRFNIYGTESYLSQMSFEFLLEHSNDSVKP